MIDSPSPYSVKRAGWNKFYCEGPYQSGKQWDEEKDAIEECNILNRVFNNGFFKNDPENNLEKIKELEQDIAHAFAEAKKWVPDYPWDDKKQTASQAVWACGSSYEGISNACEDWINLFKHLAPEQYASLLKMPSEDINAYNALMEKIKKETDAQKSKATS